jgi:MFS family permease
MDLLPKSRGFLTLLKKRNFLRLWLAQLISQTIFNASNSALLVLINNITGGSTTGIGLAIICFSVPAILFGAPAGVVVDHMDKRLVLWSSNCLRALATLFFVIVLFLNRGGLLPIIYLLTFLISTIGQFFTPAEGSTIPMLVEHEELMPALSLFNITFMFSQALGYVLIAPLILILLPTITLGHLMIDSTTQLYILICILYLVCALLIFAISPANFSTHQVHELQAGEHTLIGRFFHTMRQVWEEMREGWGFVRHNKALFLAVVQLSFAGVLILVIGELATPIVTRLLLLPANRMAFIFAPAGVGLVGGSILMPRTTKRLGDSQTILLGTLLLAASMVLIPLLTFLAQWLQPHGWNADPLFLLVIAIIMCIAGAALDCVNVPAQTEMQEKSPEWIKGRVLSLQLVLYNAASIPIILFLGIFSDTFGVTAVLFMVAAFALGFGLWGLYYERKHALRHPPDQPDERPPTGPRTIGQPSTQSH